MKLRVKKGGRRSQIPDGWSSCLFAASWFAAFWLAAMTPCGGSQVAGFLAEAAAGEARESSTDSERLVAVAVERAKRLIAMGRPAAAYALLRRAARKASAAGADTAPIRYMAAQALFAGGRYAEAEKLLRRLAEARPELDRVRLELAAMLFVLGRDDGADAIFREIHRKESLPPEIRRRVEKFLERIRARQRLRIDFITGFWRDDNVNNASERDAVAIPAFGNLRFRLNRRPVRAWVARTGVRLRWRAPVAENGRAFFETDASVVRNTAIGASAHNRTWASVSTGPRFLYAVQIAGRRRPGLLRADLGVERRWRGGDPYAASVWAGFGVEQSITRDWRVGASPRVWITRYDEGARDAQPWGRSLGLYVSRRVGPGWLTAGGKVSRETPERRSLGWRSREASLRYAANLGENWSVTLRASRTKTKLEDEAWLFLKRREDKTRTIGLTLSHRRLAWRGYLPELTLNLSRTESNIPLHDRNARMVQIGFRRLF